MRVLRAAHKRDHGQC